MKKSQIYPLIIVLSIMLVIPLLTGIPSDYQTNQLLQSQFPPTPEAPFDNIILMIGDGMGWGQLNATLKVLSPSDNLTIEELTYLGDVETSSLNEIVTDSAAAGTALATGNRTNNAIVAMTPDGEILTSILETAEELGKSTGIVTTTRLTHATPATFGAHVMSRNFESSIASQLINKEIEVLLGGGMMYFSSLLGQATSNGYHIVENRTELLSSVNEDYLLGPFTSSHMAYESIRDPFVEPHIAEMTNISLQILDRNANGFFLMVEGGKIDLACHDWDIGNTTSDTIAFDEAVKIAYEFTQQNDRTLLIVTADHETGGLIVNMTNPILDYQYTSTYHTDAKVAVFAHCTNPENLPTFSHLENIGEYLFEAFGVNPGHLPLEWVEPPTNQFIEYGNPCYYALSAYAAAGFDSWWINETTFFSIDSTGIVRNTSFTPVGIYGLEVRVNDTQGSSITAYFSIIIQDTTPPVWVTIPIDQSLLSGETLNYQLEAMDLSGPIQWMINDTDHFTIDSSGRLTSIGILLPGNYGLNITVADTHSNSISTIIQITIQSITPPPPPVIPGFPVLAIAIGLSLTIILFLIIRYKSNDRLNND
ncbi:MAG: alkaline phosphatase [Candidatus Thorarchaeota archaeon]